jgi:hypothetical protein
MPTVHGTTKQESGSAKKGAGSRTCEAWEREKKETHFPLILFNAAQTRSIEDTNEKLYFRI